MLFNVAVCTCGTYAISMKHVWSIVLGTAGKQKLWESFLFLGFINYDHLKSRWQGLRE